ncbi:ArdC family protein [Photobacterium damselae]|uniref:Antirestriction protein n=2 Tax=Photobacterium damselae TaxID=38293 RepID=D0Z527_PHODD|nr:antirestriction protein [Photobacterium damselae subsp. damselae CIP 102761]SPY45189.1 DNA primase TraC [Photobacterium damselae]
MYQLVTDRVIAALEQGVKPWSCPWERSNQSTMLPMNLKTGARYTGINVLLLWSSAAERGFTSPYWLTYKQAQELGGNVVKGQKGTTIVFYTLWEKEDGDGKLDRIPMLKTFTVFNLDQLENIDKPDLISEPTYTKNEFNLLPHVEAAIEKTHAQIEYRGSRAFYSLGDDKIVIPNRDRFHSQSDLYATIWHELVHFTGHPSRLDRNIMNQFGSKDYAVEELVAELGAAFCCADLGIIGEAQHESYIASWLHRLRNDKRFIFKAASLASKAHQFLLP